ncbi:outer membrane beta-barrel protein [Compostibacter hankyongensis]|uniref:Outer membrane protein beta-barrel domain-containing protein n=1 Tax=Compostibacter hankyongensis TaxID=1007089 RepID=A0ABP8FNA0_9BACT
MKNILKGSLALLLVLGFQQTQAQMSRLNANLNYSISQPLGTLKDYANKTSFNGWNVSLMYSVTPEISVGLQGGFNDYYERIPRQVYHSGSSDVSAVQTHTLQLIPVQAAGIYTFGGVEPGIHPYAGLGVGIADVNYDKYWGEFSDSHNKVAFSVSPMAGVRIPFGQYSPLGLNVGVKYNFTPYSYNEIKNISNVEGNVGLTLNIR